MKLINDTLVVGGGVAGLLYAYNHLCTLITPERDLGGMFARPASVPMLVHATDAVRQLMDDIGVSHTSRTCSVGYLYDRCITPVIELDVWRQYLRRSRSADGYFRQVSSPQYVRHTFDCIAVSASDVVSALIQSLRQQGDGDVIWYGTLVGIGGESVSVCTLDGVVHELHPEHLISTIPAPDFYGCVAEDALAGLGPSAFFWRDKYVVKSRLVDVMSLLGIDRIAAGYAGDEYDYIYTVSVLHGITRIMLDREHQGMVNVELVDSPERDRVIATLTKGTSIHSRIKYAYILGGNGDGIDSLYMTEHFGRTAEWNDDLLFHNLVDRCSEE